VQTGSDPISRAGRDRLAGSDPRRGWSGVGPVVCVLGAISPDEESRLRVRTVGRALILGAAEQVIEVERVRHLRLLGDRRGDRFFRRVRVRRLGRIRHLQLRLCLELAPLGRNPASTHRVDLGLVKEDERERADHKDNDEPKHGRPVARSRAHAQGETTARLTKSRIAIQNCSATTSCRDLPAGSS